MSISPGKVYLDANVFIYLLEGYTEFMTVLSQLADWIDAGDLKAYTSELSLAEVLVKPMMDENAHLQHLYQTTIQTNRNLSVSPVDRDVLIYAAQLRAKLGSSNNSIRLPDAIHVATAHINDCTYFITNDKALETMMTDTKVLLLSTLKTRTLTLV